MTLEVLELGKDCWWAFMYVRLYGLEKGQGWIVSGVQERLRWA